MGTSSPGKESVTELIYQEMLKKIVDSDLFDDDARRQLKELVDSGGIKYAESVINALALKPGDGDEDTKA